MKRKKLKLLFLIPAALIVTLFAAFVVYASVYYHADETAKNALESDDNVVVSKTDYGYLFDGYSEDTALIFYPGAKVEEESYAPLLHLLASKGVDVCLIETPLRFAFFGMNKADSVISQTNYSSYYIGGHSLGGVIAANYAAENTDIFDGVVLLAAYPTKQLEDDLKEITIYGTADNVLSMERFEKYRGYSPSDAVELAIPGANHAQFGNYGEQSGDGKAEISAEEQQEKTADYIIEQINR